MKKSNGRLLDKTHPFIGQTLESLEGGCVLCASPLEMEKEGPPWAIKMTLSDTIRFKKAVGDPKKGVESE